MIAKLYGQNMMEFILRNKMLPSDLTLIQESIQALRISGVLLKAASEGASC